MTAAVWGTPRNNPYNNLGEVTLNNEITLHENNHQRLLLKQSLLGRRVVVHSLDGKTLRMPRTTAQATIASLVVSVTITTFWCLVLAFADPAGIQETWVFLWGAYLVCFAAVGAWVTIQERRNAIAGNRALEGGGMLSAKQLATLAGVTQGKTEDFFGVKQLATLMDVPRAKAKVCGTVPNKRARSWLANNSILCPPLRDSSGD